MKKSTFVPTENQKPATKPATDPTSDWDAPPSGLVPQQISEKILATPGWPSIDEV
jgi:hypothetical protein